MNFGDSLSTFLHSTRWKKTQNYIYSWGASVVLIGALFKLEHLPFASVFLGVGLSIEALIFFVSAFEPLMDPPDWKAVYPQLRTGKEDEKELKELAEKDEKYKSFFGGGGGSISLGDIPKEQMDSLKESFEKLSKTANGLKDISDSTVATQSFINNLTNASQSIETVVVANNNVSTVMGESVQEIAKSYKAAALKIQTSAENSASGINQSLADLSGSVTKTTEGLKASVDKINSGIDKTLNDLSASGSKIAKDIETTSVEFAKKVDSSAKDLTNSYKEMTSSLTNGFKGLENSSQNYVSNIDKLNKNLTAINTAYELHLKGASKVEQMVSEYSKGVGEIGKLLNSSVEETKKFNQNTKEINENIQALNVIYGRMLGVLNGKK